MARLQEGPLNKRRIALMPRPWQAIAKGERDLSELTDEEVFKGQLLDAQGRFGPRPQFYPQNFIDEQIRRSLDRANDEIRSGARDAIKVLKDIMNNDRAAHSDRLKAAMFFTDRFLGKEISRVLITAEDPVETLFRNILEDPDGLAPHEPSAEEREMLL